MTISSLLSGERSQESPNPAGPALPPPHFIHFLLSPPQAFLKHWHPMTRSQAAGRGSEKEKRIGELTRRGHRGFPYNSRQSMNHMQMTPNAQAQLEGGGTTMGTPALAEAHTGPLCTPYPARSRAGRDRAGVKPQQWAGSIYKLSRKRHSNARTKPQPPPSPMLLRSAGKGWGAATPFFQGSPSSPACPHSGHSGPL